ncbi:hypothetical protein J5N97_000362 [Dioscorea zingiberensis]|uniref:RING-type domain-containing protein n=1 Tax=Dioscorea zingiberensis TaxID=325984 RepID=A0A9D5BVG6_9LILI|nr:hypothetical protein J5N97_000362 [Dioscorea zingiberensis]
MKPDKQTSPGVTSTESRRSGDRGYLCRVAILRDMAVGGAGNSECPTCVVCLNQVRSRDKVWELRNCTHVKQCLDRWLDHDEHLTCPLCQAPLLACRGAAASLSQEPSWAVEKLLYLFGVDVLFPTPFLLPRYFVSINELIKMINLVMWLRYIENNHKFHVSCAVPWNTLLNGYAHVSDEKKVVSPYWQIPDLETRLNKHTLSIVLKYCSRLDDARHSGAVHYLAIKFWFNIHEYLGCALVDIYSKSGLIEDAYKIFARINASTVVVWSAMISCFDQQGFGV